MVERKRKVERVERKRERKREGEREVFPGIIRHKIKLKRREI